MDQLKFRESSVKKRQDRDQTSQKKYGFKYYDYCDMVPNRHRLADSALAHSVCQPRVKPLNLQKSFTRKAMNSVSEHNVARSHILPPKSNKPQQYTLEQQLQYYQVICKNLRKQNNHLKEERENMKKKTKRKVKSNKQNADSSRYEEMLKQLNSIQNKLNKPEYVAKNNYKVFYLDFVKSLSELGIAQPKSSRSALNQWRKIVGYLSCD